MKNTLRGCLIGVLGTIMVLGCIAYAAGTTKTIDVVYNNIKVYKDNVLCETKDANGTVVEPFIYNGTTYMPVRGTANLAGMDVTWDGKTKSVYLWDKMTPGEMYLLDVCPPYQASDYYTEYLQKDGKSFKMAGKKYSNGFTLGSGDRYAIFNLDGKYSTLTMTLGAIDDAKRKIDMTVSVFLDQELIEVIEVEAEGMPQTVSIPVEDGLQLKILVTNEQGGYSGVGFGNVTVE